MPMEKQPNTTKSMDGNMFIPMANADGCRWL